MTLISKEEFFNVVTCRYIDLCKYAIKHAIEKQYAQDCVHDAIVSIANKLSIIDFKNIDDYLFKTVRNICKNSRYKHLAVKENDDYDILPDQRIR